jgi:hypothetical protein
MEGAKTQLFGSWGGHLTTFSSPLLFVFLCLAWLAMALCYWAYPGNPAARRGLDSRGAGSKREREREISLGYWLKEPEEIVSNYWQREYKKLRSSQ